MDTKSPSKEIQSVTLIQDTVDSSQGPDEKNQSSKIKDPLSKFIENYNIEYISLLKETKLCDLQKEYISECNIKRKEEIFKIINFLMEHELNDFQKIFNEPLQVCIDHLDFVSQVEWNNFSLKYQEQFCSLVKKYYGQISPEQLFIWKHSNPGARLFPENQYVLKLLAHYSYSELITIGDKLIYVCCYDHDTRLLKQSGKTPVYGKDFSYFYSDDGMEHGEYRDVEDGLLEIVSTIFR